MGHRVLGIDVGGSGIKGAIVNTKTGTLLSERYRVKTPVPSTPKAMAKAVGTITRHFDWKGPIGCGMPGPIKQGRMMLVNNLDKSWEGLKAHEVFRRATGCPVTVVNDADAAGVAEMMFGSGKGRKGVVLVVTLGTGIGSALFVDGHLVPNTELGQIELKGRRAELRAAARVRKEKALTWDQWAKRLDEYFKALELYLWPDLIIVGGGVSRKAGKFLPKIDVRSVLVPAKMRNEAGIVGAAVCARRSGGTRPVPASRRRRRG
jgi:polyphosphate glucokinase